MGACTFPRIWGPGSRIRHWRCGPHASDAKRVAFPLPRYTRADVELVKRLVEAGEYRAVVDRHYPLEQVVAATRYVETETKTGSVVLCITTDTRRGSGANRPCLR